jgi:ribosomal protein S18 acetylase RimI-like enzyme
MSESLPAGYAIRQGSTLDRALLLKFLQRTYAEITPGSDFTHLAETVDQYFSKETPLWWVHQPASKTPIGLPSLSASLSRSGTVGCLWLGTAIAQSTGLSHTHIFLLYVTPSHRRQGLGKALMRQAEEWTAQRGDRQISLQVFQNNEPALNLYRSLGYEIESLWMVKRLEVRE